ncbi:MAG: hypothetical protein ACYCYN_04400, partial [Solirubrobacteraceae bacterium]
MRTGSDIADGEPRPGRGELVSEEMGAQPLESQQAILMRVLRDANGNPVSYEQLRHAGIEFPASVACELELAGVDIERCHLERAGGDGTAASRAGGDGTAASRAGGDGTAASRAGRDGTAASRAGRDGTAAREPGLRLQPTPAEEAVTALIAPVAAHAASGASAQSVSWRGWVDRARSLHPPARARVALAALAVLVVLAIVLASGGEAPGGNTRHDARAPAPAPSKAGHATASTNAPTRRSAGRSRRIPTTGSKATRTRSTTSTEASTRQAGPGQRTGPREGLQRPSRPPSTGGTAARRGLAEATGDGAGTTDELSRRGGEARSRGGGEARSRGRGEARSRG